MINTRKKLTKEEFVEKAKLVHNDKYDYSLILSKDFVYKNNKTKVPIICHEKDENGIEHGIFWQTPNNHLRGQECPKCKLIRYTQESFINKCKKIYGDKYDLSKVVYKGSHEYITVICPEHGEFKVKAYLFLQHKACPKCGGTEKLTTEEFIKRAKDVHGDKYDYSKVKYVNNRTLVCIICPKHGEFWQKPMHHLFSKCGCPYCRESHLEKEISLFLKENDIKFERQKTFDWLKGKGNFRLDFYLLDYNVAIECQGEQHFRSYSEKTRYSVESTIERDKIKKALCDKHSLKIYYYTNIHLREQPYKLYFDKRDLLKEILNE